VQDELTRILALAGDQFVVRSGGQRHLVSGYPGSEAATADALICLPGLLLATGRTAEAKRLLRSLAGAVSAGMLPDRLPGADSESEGGAGARRRGESAATEARQGTSLDASLWFAVALHRYWQASGDDDLVREALLPALARVVGGHEEGAPNGLRAGGDGLLEAAPGSPAAALRPGKAAEVNALWVNALATLAEHGARLGDKDAKAWAERARRVQRRYGEVFWSAGDGCLFDSVTASEADGAGGTAPAPHQVLAIGLPFPALSKVRGQRLLGTIEERLYTPAGLRDRAAPPATLGAGGDRSMSAGSARSAGSGHHDLAWPWLLGPFLTALIWLRGAAGRRQALQHLAELDAQLASGAVGTLPELAGAEPPHLPAGHLAHAASVGELLRVYVAELHAAPAPTKPKPAPAKPPRQAKVKTKTAPARPRGRQGAKRQAPKSRP
jgi:predicted glycogen debranching enzyme